MESNCHSLDIHIHHLHRLRRERGGWKLHLGWEYVLLEFLSLYMSGLFIKKKWKNRSGGLNWFSGPPIDPDGSHGFQWVNCMSDSVACPNRCTLQFAVRPVRPAGSVRVLKHWLCLCGVWLSSIWCLFTRDINTYDNLVIKWIPQSYYMYLSLL